MIFILEAKMIRDDTVVKPGEASEADLRVVHSKEYINSLKVRQLLFPSSNKCVKEVQLETDGGLEISTCLFIERGQIKWYNCFYNINYLSYFF